MTNEEIKTINKVINNYILVANVNDYNQYGKYYVENWNKIPSKEELKTAIESSNFTYESIDYDLILKSIEDNSVDTRIKPTIYNDAWFEFIVKIKNDYKNDK